MIFNVDSLTAKIRRRFVRGNAKDEMNIKRGNPQQSCGTPVSRDRLQTVSKMWLHQTKIRNCFCTQLVSLRSRV